MTGSSDVLLPGNIRSKRDWISRRGNGDCILFVTKDVIYGTCIVSPRTYLIKAHDFEEHDG